MTFILVPKTGADIQINAWNWRPTLEILLAEGLITEDEHQRLGMHGLGEVDESKALQFADSLTKRLSSMSPNDRVLADLSISTEPKQPTVFSGRGESNIDVNELYSTSYEWLLTFEEFCRRSGGFIVL